MEIKVDINAELQVVGANAFSDEEVLMYDEMIEAWMYAAQHSSHGPVYDDYSPQFPWEQ